MRRSLSSSSSSVLLLLLVLLPFIHCEHTVSVKGELLCGTAPAFGVRVKLFRKNKGADTNDLLDHGFADKEGTFHLTGKSDSNNIEPTLKVYHDCNDGTKPGQRKFIFKIPEQYVVEAKNPEKVFNLGVVNLEVKIHREERTDKVHRMRRSRHRRFKDVEVIGCDSCTIQETTNNAKNGTSKFHNLDESPESRSDPW